MKKTLIFSLFFSVIFGPAASILSMAPERIADRQREIRQSITQIKQATSKESMNAAIQKADQLIQALRPYSPAVAGVLTNEMSNATEAAEERLGLVEKEVEGPVTKVEKEQRLEEVDPSASIAAEIKSGKDTLQQIKDGVLKAGAAATAIAVVLVGAKKAYDWLKDKKDELTDEQVNQLTKDIEEVEQEAKLVEDDLQNRGVEVSVTFNTLMQKLTTIEDKALEDFNKWDLKELQSVNFDSLNADLDRVIREFTKNKANLSDDEQNSFLASEDKLRKKLVNMEDVYGQTIKQKDGPKLLIDWMKEGPKVVGEAEEPEVKEEEPQEQVVTTPDPQVSKNLTAQFEKQVAEVVSRQPLEQFKQALVKKILSKLRFRRTYFRPFEKLQKQVADARGSLTDPDKNKINKLLDETDQRITALQLEYFTTILSNYMQEVFTKLLQKTAFYVKDEKFDFVDVEGKVITLAEVFNPKRSVVSKNMLTILKQFASISGNMKLLLEDRLQKEAALTPERVASPENKLFAKEFKKTKDTLIELKDYFEDQVLRVMKDYAKDAKVGLFERKNASDLAKGFIEISLANLYNIFVYLGIAGMDTKTYVENLLKTVPEVALTLQPTTQKVETGEAAEMQKIVDELAEKLDTEKGQVAQKSIRDAIKAFDTSFGKIWDPYIAKTSLRGLTILPFAQQILSPYYDLATFIQGEENNKIIFTDDTQYKNLMNTDLKPLDMKIKKNSLIYLADLINKAAQDFEGYLKGKKEIGSDELTLLDNRYNQLNTSVFMRVVVLKIFALPLFKDEVFKSEVEALGKANARMKEIVNSPAAEDVREDFEGFKSDVTSLYDQIQEIIEAAK